MSELLFEQVEEMAKNLSQREKVKLIKRLSDMIDEEYEEREPKKPRHSLAGLWQGVNVSEEAIDEARHEMWANFPREDI